MATPPLATSRTCVVHGGVQLTIEIDGTSTFADAPANVSVKPGVAAPADVTVPAKPGIALTAAATLALLTRASQAEHGGVLAADLDLERTAWTRRTR